MILQAPNRLATRVAAACILLATACTAPGGKTTAASSPSTAHGEHQPYALGTFPELPSRELPDRVTDALQNVLDERVREGRFPGVTAAVIVADEGSWSGAAGSAFDAPVLNPDLQRPIGSVGKTITAAQVVRLAEIGQIELDDPADRYLSEDMRFDTNGASIRDLLRMQSGIPDPDDIFAAIELGPMGYLAHVPDERLYPAGQKRSNYSNTNFLLLGLIVERLMNRPLSESLASGVLSDPGLEGIIYRADDPTGAMGLMSADPESLARWGYLLYGGHILSRGSLDEVSDYRNNYGLGSMEITNDPDDPGIGHLGNDHHDSAGLVAFPRAGIAIAVLMPTGGCCDRVANTIEELRQVLRTSW